MSRVGKNPLALHSGVECAIQGQTFSVKGPKGELSHDFPQGLSVAVENGSVIVNLVQETRMLRALWGTTQRILRNLIEGVSKGFSVNLEISGVGYRAAVQGNVLKMQLGYSHDVEFSIPQGITITCPKPTSLTVSGIDRQKVGQTAAEISEFRRPEPYKKKGIHREGRFVLSKEGKKK